MRDSFRGWLLVGLLAVASSVLTPSSVFGQTCPAGSCWPEYWCWNICQTVIYQDMPPFPGTCSGEEGLCQPVTCFTFIENDIPPEALVEARRPFADLASGDRWAAAARITGSPTEAFVPIPASCSAPAALFSRTSRGARSGESLVRRIAFACSNPHLCEVNYGIMCVT